MKAPDKIYVEVCEDGIFAFPEPPFAESVEYIRADINKRPVKGLDEEMEKFFETMPVLEHENIFEDTFQNIARHFAEWGKKNTLDHVVEWMKKNLVFTHPRKGEDACIVNIGAFLDAMNDDE